MSKTNIVVAKLLSILTLFGTANQVQAVEMPMFVQPLAIAYSYFDKHVMLYFEGHPRYEAMEAMISDRSASAPDIRIVLTRHNQTQLDYFSNEKLLQKFRSDIPQRESYAATIAYSSNQYEQRPLVNISFTTTDKVKVSFNLIAASKPSAKYGGMTDPEGHAGTTALPLMIRQRSSLADEASSIRFDGQQYEIPVHTYIPFFFTGMKGYYSEQFRIGVIAAQDVSYSSIELPHSLSPDNAWVYHSATGARRYTIKQVADKRIIVQSDQEELELLSLENGLALHEIKRFSTSENPSESMRVHFDPYLPYQGGHWPRIVNFTMSISNAEETISGTVKLSEKGFSLIPQTPTWATSRVVRTESIADANRLLSSVGGSD